MAGEPTPIDPALRIDSVRLAVSDLARSADFYTRVLGLPRISHDAHEALLGTDPERPALALVQLADPAPIPRGSTGLFHVAWLSPSRAALASALRRVTHNRWPIDGTADHGVSEALYLSDPDGLGIELYADRPRARWERPPDGRGVKMVTLPLDVEDLLLAQTAAEDTPMAALGTGIGHVHLQVSDVPRAVTFYRDALGFEEQAQLPSAAFLSAGGYHHHVGLNSWHSHGGRPAPDSAPGLRHVVFELTGAQALDALERRLSNTAAGPSSTRGEDGRLTLRDPDRQLLSFTSAARTGTS
jgi:catechol 2,3-dioxygenase